ncbi:MAG: P22 phage major capsid protein family protein [Terriglobia bacterium]
MANQFSFSNWVAMEALRLLTNKLEVAQFFNTTWMRQFEQEFAVGSSVQVKLPQRFTIRTGLGYTPQPINRITTTVNCNQIKGIDFEWDSIEKALQMERSNEEISKQYLEPAAAQLAQQVDSDASLFAAQNANNIVGVLGTDPTTTTTIMQARQRLFELACPWSGEKGMLVTPSVNTALVPSLQALFNPSSDISQQYKQGSIGKLNGFDWYESMSLARLTAGTWQAAVTIDGTGQSGSSLLLHCTNGDTFNQGDVFNIANVNQVNPMTRTVLTAVLKEFVVTQSVTATAATVTIPISPAIYGPGSQYQNVDSLPADTAALTLYPGTTSPNGKSGAQNLAIHPDAFAMVSVKLESPEAVEVISQKRDPKTGIAVRFIRAFDPAQSRMINRWDMVYGFGAMYPDNCCVRMLGA